MFGNRANTGSERLNDYLISGADTFINASSAGSTILTSVSTNDTTRINIRDNTAPGRVARYTGISPGADGAFSVLVTAPTVGDFTQLAVGRLDLVSVDVPEPAVIPLLGLGMAWLAARRFRETKGHVAKIG